jgi:predicted nucleic acid-binding protein
VDTSVLVAGISGFRAGAVSTSNPSARLLRNWLERGTFTWIVSEEILDEYKSVLGRLKVRRDTIGILVNLLREEAELIAPRSRRKISPDPADDPFCACAEEGSADFLVTLNSRDFPQEGLSAKVIAPDTPLTSRRQMTRRGGAALNR